MHHSEDRENAFHVPDTKHCSIQHHDWRNEWGGAVKSGMSNGLLLNSQNINTSCWNGAMPGINSIAENSIVPSTLKCTCVKGSRNSEKVCL